MANSYIWAGLERATNDPTTIDQAIAEGMAAHNADPEAHLGDGESLQSHRAAEIIDHLAESVVNDKIRRTARRYVAIVDPNSDTDFDTLASAIEYARGVGGGDIYLTRGTHFLSADIPTPPTIGLYGDGVGETTLKSNNTTARSIALYTDSFPSSGYMLFDDSANGQSTFVFDAVSNPGIDLVVGMYLRLYATEEHVIEITAYNPTTRVATLASPMSDIDGEAEAEFYAGFAFINGSSTVQILTNNDEPLENYYAGMSIYNGANGAIARTIAFDGVDEFTLAEPWASSTQHKYGYLKFVENNTINIQGITFDRYTNPVSIGGQYGNATAYIENCQNVLIYASSALGVPAMFVGCVFDCKPTGSGGYQHLLQQGITYLNCTFRALANGSHGVGVFGNGRLIACQFLANGYTNHLWIQGRSEDATIQSCLFESQDGTTIFNSTGSGTTGSLKFIGNHFTFENNKTLTVQVKRGVWLGNKFIFSGTGVLAFNAGGKDNIFSQNNVVGDVTDAGTGNIIKDNFITNGGQFVMAGTADTAMALRWRETTQLTPNSTRTLTTTIAPAGARRMLVIVTSGTTSYTLTFGTGFKSTGTLATGTTSARRFIFEFVSDGTSMIETSRTVAIA